MDSTVDLRKEQELMKKKSPFGVYIKATVIEGILKYEF
jgi:hypothetical protein